MNDETVVAQPEREIIQNILAEAEVRAQRARDSAQNAIEAEDAKAAKEREGTAREILGKAEDTARKDRAREVATAHVEAQRILLLAREEAVAAVLSQIEQGLTSLRENKEEYRISLTRLAAQAVQAIGEPEVRLYIDNADRGLVDNAFLDAVRSAVRQGSGRELAVQTDFSRTDLGGGCMAAALNGRMVFDNTFSKRLERMRNRLRTSIVEDMTKNHE